MADYEVKLKVDAESGKAKRELDEIVARGKRVKSTLGIDDGARTPRPPTPQPPEPHESRAPARPQPPATPPPTPDKPGRSRRGNRRRDGHEMGDEFSKVAGKAIGKAIAGFVAHEVSGLVFEGFRTYGGDNTNVDRAQAAAGGALQYGTMGAMVGGPWGAAIGALVGGVTSLVGQLQKEKQQRAAVDQNIRMSYWQAAEGATSGIGKSALGALLDRAWAGNGGRAAILRRQAKDMFGNYKDARSKFEEASGWDPNSEAFKVRQADFQGAQQAYFGALQDYANERIANAGSAKPYEARELGDSFSARGMYVGPQVDVAGVNDTLGDRMQEQVNLLRQLVDISNAGAGHDSANFRELIDKVDRLSL